MHDDPVIPERNGARRPFPANSKVVCIEEMVAEEGEDVMRFLAVEFLDPVDESWVVVERLEASHWMGSNLWIRVSENEYKLRRGR